MSKKHIPELDYLRAFAFVAVILQHVLGFYNRNSNFSDSDNLLIGLSFSLVKFAVPLFVFLSGMVLFLHYYNNLKYGQFLWKRLISIYIPFVLWSLFYLLYPHTTLWEIDAGFLKTLPKHLLYGTGKYHLWYVAMIVQIFILLPIIFIIYKKVENHVKTTLQFVVAIALFTTVYLLYIRFYLNLFGHFTNGHLQNFFSMMYARGFLSYSFYFVMGGIAAKYYDTWIYWLKSWRIKIWAITGILYIYITYTAFTTSENVINLNAYGSLTIKMFLFTICSIMALYLLALYLHGRFGTPKVILTTSKFSYGAYLAHGLVLGEIYALLLPIGLNVKIFYSMVFILTTILSIVIGGCFQWLWGYPTKLLVKK